MAHGDLIGVTLRSEEDSMARKAGKTRSGSVKPTRARPPSHRAVATALARFKQRAADLVLAYALAGRSTVKLRRAARQFKDDIDAWGARTGLRDIRAGHSTMTKWPDDDDWTCDKNCDLIMVSRGRLCFLVGCNPAYKNCSYVCVDLPTNHTL
jgi:hypothetical protein